MELKPKKRPYKSSVLTQSQRESACLTRRRVTKVLNRFHPNLVVGDVIGDSGKLKSLDRLVDCVSCEVRGKCGVVLNGDGSDKVKCPLFSLYRETIVDVIHNPLRYLGKEAGKLSVQVMKQEILDKAVPNVDKAGHVSVLNPLTMKAVELGLKAVDIRLKAERALERSSGKGRGGMRIVSGDSKAGGGDAFIDAEFREDTIGKVPLPAEGRVSNSTDKDSSSLQPDRISNPIRFKEESLPEPVSIEKEEEQSPPVEEPNLVVAKKKDSVDEPKTNLGLVLEDENKEEPKGDEDERNN